MTDALRDVGPMFRRIGRDSHQACRDRDEERFKKLTQLTIALERAYPREMEILREDSDQ